MKATNTKEAPDNVSPTRLADVQIDGHRITARLKPGSWNVIVTTNAKAS